MSYLRQANPPHTVKGNLRRRLPYWENIGTNKTILELIKYGYKIPFFTTPKKASFKNNCSAFDNEDLVNKELHELLKTGRIKEMATEPHVVNPLSVSSSKNKKRLILDLRHVNKHVYKQKTTFDDWKIFGEFVEGNGFMFKFDIKQGYHHIEIAPEHQKYLGFSWVKNGEKRYFVFTVLPFGVSSAPFIFTKTMRVLVKHWREHAMKFSCFIDDGAGTSKTYEATLRASNFVRDSLKKSGFVANNDKSLWSPTQNMTWLGINLDLKKKLFSILSQRLISTLSSLQFILDSLPYTSARKLGKFCGKIISMKFVIGNLAQLKIRRRELYAIQYSLQSLKSVLCNKAVLWKTDNYASHCIIKRGSSKENLQILAENIFDICKKQKIDLNVEWVPRNQIQYADKLGRYTDTDNWEITKSFFEYLNRLWGPFTVDRFANDENKKTCKALGTLVAPYWPSAAFWPFLTDSTGDFKKFIKNFRIFDNPNLCVTQGECNKSAIGSKHFKSKIIAFKLQFT
ncbi:uncharacterized protein LOC130625224 [Hydractinia symbiolongicarpus]|uniref:uncharacterized protein LOC130625224 n=1 Tax=Hydractinia symbiolongicarpus TaxID=13093 RepID=UPI002550A28D|nr:uncharacterized protein LOC130625224 [Hydractinia symbiolongicarpus]